MIGESIERGVTGEKAKDRNEKDISYKTRTIIVHMKRATEQTDYTT